MKKTMRLMFVPGKGKARGHLLIKDHKGSVVVRIPAHKTFDPATL